MLHTGRIDLTLIEDNQYADDEDGYNAAKPDE
jgi:hypothetical protein